jgi:hypothetical protein
MHRLCNNVIHHALANNMQVLLALHHWLQALVCYSISGAGSLLSDLMVLEGQTTSYFGLDVRAGQHLL